MRSFAFLKAKTCTRRPGLETLVVLWSIVTITATVRANPPSRSCPKLKPVPIDENFLFGKQPPDGFYVSHGSGEDSIPRYTSKPNLVDKRQLEGPNKVCIQVEVVVGGGGRNSESISGPPIDCSYNAHGVSAMYCESGTNTGSGGGGGGPGLAFVNSAMYQLPTSEVGSIVDTDNRTYFAWGCCLDGALYWWSIFTIDPTGGAGPNGPRSMLSRTAKALNVTKKEVKESRWKKLKVGRTKFTRGACNSVVGGRTESASADVTVKEQVKESFSGFSSMFWAWAHSPPAP